MTICSYVGGHDIRIFKDCVYDPATRKYRGGVPCALIPWSGQLLNVTYRQASAGVLNYGGTDIPCFTAGEILSVDPLPGGAADDYCLVSTQYALACKLLGLDTSRLLTPAGLVTDEAGNIIGATGFNRN